ncbi:MULTISPECIES: cell division protein ZapA [Basfia]|uniref:Cell division protein ZapA n=2 Tax=Basfia TaxID=697331 RepID=ZAPA_MANSM|nr:MULTISPECIES: cell division protein ZapA [Basfia]Q65VC6.2 RecName: Full=Cell division protein ZapA; AltName: Full=Z ring-associated protein ZapA [[Mannheimia] succiniciproducens MBEL55E]QIM67942.1 cell division protein ZapA [Basfia succiniciproducens]SCY13454.1 cell division protein ZapA [Basfia succiniciproducens]SEQ41510.1 cell division protein ZapA [Basfia succiniciproducens]
MSSKTIELNFLGQVLRLNCPEEQHDSLREAAKLLDSRVTEMKDRTGILQVEKALAIVALNLSFELLQEQHKTHKTENVLQNQIEQLTRSLESISASTPTQQASYSID